MFNLSTYYDKIGGFFEISTLLYCLLGVAIIALAVGLAFLIKRFEGKKTNMILGISILSCIAVVFLFALLRSVFTQYSIKDFFHLDFFMITALTMGVALIVSNFKKADNILRFAIVFSVILFVFNIYKHNLFKEFEYILHITSIFRITTYLLLLASGIYLTISKKLNFAFSGVYNVIICYIILFATTAMFSLLTSNDASYTFSNRFLMDIGLKLDFPYLLIISLMSTIFVMICIYTCLFFATRKFHKQNNKVNEFVDILGFIYKLAAILQGIILLCVCSFFIEINSNKLFAICYLYIIASYCLVYAATIHIDSHLYSSPDVVTLNSQKLQILTYSFNPFISVYVKKSIKNEIDSIEFIKKRNAKKALAKQNLEKLNTENKSAEKLLSTEEEITSILNLKK